VRVKLTIPRANRLKVADANQPAGRSHSKATAAEEARIRNAYARRKDRPVYTNLYSWFNPGQLFMAQEREIGMLSLLRHCGCEELKSKRILEVGCGGGYWLREFIKWGARPENLAGIDLLEDRVVEARRLCPSEVKIECGNAASLHFADESFDLVLQSTVFTSILDSSMREQVAAEMMRVVKRDGLILWYDYHVNNPRNKDVRAVRRGEIHKLFPDCRIQLKRITLLPPLVRLLAPYSYLTCHLLEKVPPLCTHYLGVIRKNNFWLAKKAFAICLLEAICQPIF
jgi:ubiquinone/menaquinone biosynthesis C-methylase UbiE